MTSSLQPLTAMFDQFNFWSLVQILYKSKNKNMDIYFSFHIYIELFLVGISEMNTAEMELFNLHIKEWSFCNEKYNKEKLSPSFVLFNDSNSANASLPLTTLPSFY